MKEVILFESQSALKVKDTQFIIIMDLNNLSLVKGLLLIPPKWIAYSFFGFGDVTSFSQVLRKWAVSEQYLKNISTWALKIS